MKEIISLREAQMIMLDMLIEIDRICEKYDLKYWLDSGTLLGAVRHGGFIPWDDDMDIAMERSDYIKFKKVAKTELNKKYFIKSPIEDKKFEATWIKLIDKGSHRNHHYESIDTIGGGVFIDILPYDSDCNYNKIKKICWGNFIELKWNSEVNTRDKNIKYYIKKLILKSYDIIGYEKIISKIFKKADKLYVDKKSEFINYGSETPWQMMLKRDNIYPLKKIKFESKEFYVPNNYKYVLEKAYGDWEKIPDEAMQTPIHSEVIYRRDLVIYNE